MNAPRFARQLGALLGVLTLLVACGDTLHGREYAEPEVTRFRALMDTRDFERIYDAAAPEFRESITRELAVALFSAVDRKLGRLEHAEQTNWNVNTHNGTTSVVLTYASKYQRGDATETFTVLVDHKKPRLAGYFISSLDMLIK